jgi:hypothetical protein
MSSSSNGRSVAAAAVSRKIRQLHADDLRWVVYEIQAPQFDRRGGTHLVFEADGVIRRVRSFPAQWYELPDAELYALTDFIRVTD